jgi:hypothetical protein
LPEKFLMEELINHGAADGLAQDRARTAVEWYWRCAPRTSRHRRGHSGRRASVLVSEGVIGVG